MREPPVDDALWPALVWLLVTAIFAVLLVVGVHHLYVTEIGPPPSSTLPPR